MFLSQAIYVLGVATISASKQDATIARQQKQIEALTSAVQKVSDRLDATQCAAQLVTSNE